MADLKFVDQHNMVAYLKKSDDNTEFHQIVDFLSSCSINYALTVSLTIYVSYIKQFWNTASSKTINYVKQIHAIVDGKAVVISKSSVRSDILFDDEDGITCLTNDDIFENLALIGYEPLSTKLTFQKGSFSPQCGSPRRQETMGGTFTQTKSERVLEQPNEPALTKGHTSRSREGKMEHIVKLIDTIPPTTHDSPLTGVYTPKSDEGRQKLEELMDLCTTLSYEGRMIEELDKDEEVNLVSQQGEVQETAEPLKDDDDATLVETLLNIKRKLQRQLDKREKDVDKGDQAQKIDWNDPTVLRYHALLNRPFYKAEGMESSLHFVPKDSKIKKEVMKRSGFYLQQERLKKQKLDQQTEEKKEEVKAQADSDQEVEEMKLYMRIVLVEDIAIDVIPLATKPLVIVEYKIVKEGKINTYHIRRANESTKIYTSMINLLENIDREDLEALWKLVKDKHRNTRPEEGYKRVL
uniref:Xylulose kinase-1 n=1 Tax=Tanacetum cinerariifolium TaxID=118510 RepID=A0A699GV89_TANCI|nr:hypothetical protein [Tanacetum cinerariifolium]